MNERSKAMEEQFQRENQILLTKLRELEHRFLEWGKSLIAGLNHLEEN